MPGGFNGEVLYFTLDRQFINGYLWKNGSITKAVSIGAAQPVQQQTQTLNRKVKTYAVQISNCTSEVYEVVWITTVTGGGTSYTSYQPTGTTLTITTCDITNTGSPTSTTTTTSGGVSGTPPPPPCSTGSGGTVTSSVKSGHLIINVTTGGTGSGSGGTTTTTTAPCVTAPTKPAPIQAVAVNKITDSVTNACLKALINRLTSDQTIQTDVTTILRNTFGTSDNINVTFDQATLAGSYATADANTTGQNNSFTVTFNTPIISGASQEYMLETTMHEIFHAYLYVNPTIRQGFSQHAYMIQNYVNTEVATLQKVFPNLSLHDAQCLVLGGYGALDPTTLNTAIASYGLTLNDVATTNNSYKTSSSGTHCLNP
jgi:hypothetical protein